MDNYGSKWREVGMLPSPRYGLRGATLGKSLISKFSFLNLFYCASIPVLGGVGDGDRYFSKDFTSRVDYEGFI